jgi:prevent-host-death family protein
MKRVGVADLKNGLSRHLREVQGGLALEITDHDRPIARLVPIEPKSRLIIQAATRPFAEVARRKHVALQLPVGSTELLRQDREIR